jgi:hypothetical protein
MESRRETNGWQTFMEFLGFLIIGLIAILASQALLFLINLMVSS